MYLRHGGRVVTVAEIAPGLLTRGYGVSKMGNLKEWRNWNGRGDACAYEDEITVGGGSRDGETIRSGYSRLKMQKLHL
jgi:hypothetical protein